jgi:predicted kinase
MLSRARRLVDNGESVIIDASFSRRVWRDAAAALAAETAAELSELVCRVPADVAAVRLAHRDASRRDASDATPDTATRMAGDFDDWPTATVVSTLAPVDRVVRSVSVELREPAHPP